MTEKKSDLLKDVSIYLGMLLILVGSTMTKGDMEYFFMALAILAIHTFEFSLVNPKKLTIAEILLAATITLGAGLQLLLATTTKSQQAFLVVLLLGGLLLAIEAIRKYADL